MWSSCAPALRGTKERVASPDPLRGWVGVGGGEVLGGGGCWAGRMAEGGRVEKVGVEWDLWGRYLYICLAYATFSPK